MTKTKAVTVNNVATVSFDELLDYIGSISLVQIPEGSRSSETAMRDLDVLIGRMANAYGTLTHLHSAISYIAEKTKLIDQEEWKFLLRKKDALETAAKTVELKWKACSRMITAYMQDEDLPFDRPNYQNRQERAGWTNVR